MKDNNNVIVTTINKGETCEDARHCETMERGNVRHHKTVEFENRRITSSKKTSCGYLLHINVHWRWYLFNQSIFSTLMFDSQFELHVEIKHNTFIML